MRRNCGLREHAWIFESSERSAYLTPKSVTNVIYTKDAVSNELHCALLLSAFSLHRFRGSCNDCVLGIRGQGRVHIRRQLPFQFLQVFWCRFGIDGSDAYWAQRPNVSECFWRRLLYIYVRNYRFVFIYYFVHLIDVLGRTQEYFIYTTAAMVGENWAAPRGNLLQATGGWQTFPLTTREDGSMSLTWTQSDLTGVSLVCHCAAPEPRFISDPGYSQ